MTTAQQPPPAEVQKVALRNNPLPAVSKFERARAEVGKASRASEHASEGVILQSPMGFSGSAKRIWRLSELTAPVAQDPIRKSQIARVRALLRARTVENKQVPSLFVRE